MGDFKDDCRSVACCNDELKWLLAEMVVILEMKELIETILGRRDYHGMGDTDTDNH
ncbi:TPA: hypothetical protein J1082_004159 [Escherichia coli]|nr:hypothetical protein [Escherichia coli]